MANRKEFKGRWALVTGASSGIGAEIARQLAGHGAKLTLTARRLDRLTALAAELRAQGTEVRVVAADLNDPTAPQQLYDATEGAGTPVDILINNAGLGQFGAFYSSPVEQELSQVRVNCEAVVRLSRLFVPRMVERRQGWVLIVSSQASFQPVPYLTTYAATKAFDRFFAEGLAAEVERLGVKVTALCPASTESEFFGVARSDAFKWRAQAPAEVARKAIDALALGKRTISPNLIGKFTAVLAWLLPVGFVTYALEKFFRVRAHLE